MQYSIPRAEETDLIDKATSEQLDIPCDQNSSGTIILYVRSKRVLSSVRLVDLPKIENGLAGNLITKRQRRIVTEDYILDQEEFEALANCTDLASRLGLCLEVRDLSRRGALEKLAGFFLGTGFSGETPSLSLDGGAVTSLTSSSYIKDNFDPIRINPSRLTESQRESSPRQ
jgi:hypothetical protein